MEHPRAGSGRWIVKDLTPWPALSAQEIVQFLENIEMSEGFDDDAKKKIAQAASNAKKGNRNKANKKNNDTSGQKFYLLHGNNNTHTTDECNTLKAQAKKLKGDTGGNAGKAKGKGKNKTQNNKSNDETDKSKGKLAAFVKKAVKDGLKQELKSIDKKRKSDSDDSSIDLHAIDIELQEFNCDDMEKLVIKDPEDGVVDDTSISTEMSV